VGRVDKRPTLTCFRQTCLGFSACQSCTLSRRDRPITVCQRASTRIEKTLSSPMPRRAFELSYPTNCEKAARITVQCERRTCRRAVDARPAAPDLRDSHYFTRVRRRWITMTSTTTNSTPATTRIIVALSITFPLSANNSGKCEKDAGKAPFSPQKSMLRIALLHARATALNHNDQHNHEQNTGNYANNCCAIHHFPPIQFPNASKTPADSQCMSHDASLLLGFFLHEETGLYKLLHRLYSLRPRSISQPMGWPIARCPKHGMLLHPCATALNQNNQHERKQHARNYADNRRAIHPVFSLL
jgi:hypothetical protein